MTVGMIANLMSFSDNTAHCFRMPFNPIPDHKESGSDIVLSEDIKQLVGIRRTWSIIKGKRDNSLICVQANNILSERRSKEKP